MPLYLGLDCGTQSFKAVVVEIEDGGARRVVLEHALAYDADLPGYGTRNGVLPDDDPLVVTAPPLLWADALDALLGEVAGRLRSEVGRIAAVGGAGQQHGSVYLAPGLDVRLGAMDPSRALAGQLADAFARKRSPVWMDVSTARQCAAITDEVGGGERLARLTGSRAFERFTGPQIRRFYETEPGAWAATDRIHLVSSFLASLLLGRHAALDLGDASGMNLMDLRRGVWAEAALQATAPGLAARLPDLVHPDTVLGRLSEYWRKRHGFPAADVVAWTGDNPSSLVGLGVVRPGVTALSLGTSDTVFGLMAEPAVDPAGTAHVFVAPTGDFMALVCFRNGSLARERVRDRFGLDWAGFDDALESTPMGNGGALMLPWFEPEITPPVTGAGVRTEGLADGAAPAVWVRACVEGQMMAMRRHSAWAAPRVERIHATGGAARSRALLQVAADVFGVPVVRSDVDNAACLGAALRAAHAHRASISHDTAWEEILGEWGEPGSRDVVRPGPGAEAVYRPLMAAQAEMEGRARAGVSPTGPPGTRAGR